PRRDRPVVDRCPLPCRRNQVSPRQSQHRDGCAAARRCEGAVHRRPEGRRLLTIRYFEFSVMKQIATTARSTGATMPTRARLACARPGSALLLRDPPDCAVAVLADKDGAGAVDRDADR